MMSRAGEMHEKSHNEAHQLSTDSFNALLKTLEEPPSYVIFILATTHPHELLQRPARLHP
jgi:DNA polymerase III delta prime subunit